MTTYLKSFLCSILVLASASLWAQTTTATPAGDDYELPKKVNETKLTEVITIPDSLPSSELLKRAVNWVKVESPRYIKSAGATTGSKAECNISFPVKPKELNPETDYTGKITMKVTIECKDSKYRYTVNQIKHISKSGQASGGSIDNTVPDCGSMNLGDITWKKLKGEAIRGANMVVADLKVGMEKPSSETATEEW